VQTEKRTLLLRIPPQLSDMLSGLLPSDEPNIGDVGTCFDHRKHDVSETGFVSVLR
jgi:hypothetical protein